MTLEELLEYAVRLGYRPDLQYYAEDAKWECYLRCYDKQGCVVGRHRAEASTARGAVSLVLELAQESESAQESELAQEAEDEKLSLGVEA